MRLSYKLIKNKIRSLSWNKNAPKFSEIGLIDVLWAIGYYLEAFDIFNWSIDATQTTEF